jgi:arylamine N-acetyltransferase
MAVGETIEQFGWTHRVAMEGAFHVLQALGTEAPEGLPVWIDQYVFTLEPQYPVDYEVANHYTSTHPNSIFRKMLLVQKPGAECRLLLQNRKLVEQQPDGAARETVLSDDAALIEVLGARFGLGFAVGTRFPLEETQTG